MFEQALIDSAQRLKDASSRDLLESFAVIGALAVARWARVRASGDIDYVISLGNAEAEELSSYLGGKFRAGDIRDPLAGAISFHEGSGKRSVPIQLLLFPPAWERVALAEVQNISIAGHGIPFADWKALVLLKLYAGSALDLEDAREILTQANPAKTDREYLKTKATALRISRRLARIIED